MSTSQTTDSIHAGPPDESQEVTVPPNVTNVKPLVETPRVAREHPELDQSKLRGPIIRVMRYEMKQLGWARFVECYLPTLSWLDDPFLDRWLIQLQETTPPVLELVDNVPQWVSFPPVIPKDPKPLPEPKFFAALEQHLNQVFEDIGKERGISPNYLMHLKPNSMYKTSIGGGNHKADGTFLQRECHGKKRPPYTSVALCIELKMEFKPEKIVENRTQLVTDTNFLINNDPRRKFAYGITIEDDACSIWYFSRSHSAKSASFNWRKDIKSFLLVTTLFAFSSPEQMGFDPNITLILKPKESFIYRVSSQEEDGRVNQRYFHTQSSISELRSTCISGRATRVWEVIEVSDSRSIVPKDSNPVKMVLKDAWINEDSKTETRIQKNIFADMDLFKTRLGDNPPELEGLGQDLQNRIRDLLQEDDRYKEYFLTVICDSLGDSSRSVPTDAISRTDLFELSQDALSRPATIATADKSRSKSQSAHRFPLQGVATQQQKTAQQLKVADRRYAPKRRYFIVFKEVCKSVDSLDALEESMEALEGGIIALLILFIAGWVHRDVSSGNILYYTSPDGKGGRGILSDLEYAKRFPSDAAGTDPKTGTAFFMAHEILAQTSLKAAQGVKYQEREDTGTPTTARRQPAYLSHIARPPGPPRHNFAHDVESFWWLYLWIITTRLPFADAAFSQSVFVNKIDSISAERVNAFTNAGALFWILDRHLDKSVRDLASDIDEARWAIHSKHLEVDFPTTEVESLDLSYKSKIAPLYRICYRLAETTLRHAEKNKADLPSLLPLRQQIRALSEMLVTSGGDEGNARGSKRGATDDLIPTGENEKEAPKRRKVFIE